MIRIAIAVLLLGAGLASASPDAPPPTDLERKLDALTREVEELRAWKAHVEREGLAPAGTPLSPVEREIQAYLDETALEPPQVRTPKSLSLDITGEIRVRGEWRNHLFAPADPGGEQSNDTVHMRTRLRFDLQVEGGIGATVELQDVRVFGEEGSTIADAEGLDLKRALISVRDVLTDGLDLDLGRTVLKYGDERLIGALEWFDQGRTYDGFRLGWQDPESFVDLFAARIRDSLTTSDDQDLLGVYGGTSALVDDLDLEGYALLVRDLLDRPGESGPGNTRIVTVGARAAWAAGGIDATGEIAYQTGEVNGDELSAWAFAVVAGYTLEEIAWKPRIGLEADFASGNEDPDDGDTEQFQVLFPTNHGLYGHADLAAWSNIWAFRLAASARPSETVKLTLDYWHFRLDEPAGGWVNAGGATIRGGDEDASKRLGDEIDLTLAWQAAKSLSLLVGWAHFFPGKFVNDTGDDPAADFGYVQVHLRF